MSTPPELLQKGISHLDDQQHKWGFEPMLLPLGTSPLEEQVGYMFYAVEPPSAPQPLISQSIPSAPKPPVVRPVVSTSNASPYPPSLPVAISPSSTRHQSPYPPKFKTSQGSPSPFPAPSHQTYQAGSEEKPTASSPVNTREGYAQVVGGMLVDDLGPQPVTHSQYSGPSPPSQHSAPSQHSHGPSNGPSSNSPPTKSSSPSPYPLQAMPTMRQQTPTSTFSPLHQPYPQHLPPQPGVSPQFSQLQQIPLQQIVSSVPSGLAPVKFQAPPLPQQTRDSNSSGSAGHQSRVNIAVYAPEPSGWKLTAQGYCFLEWPLGNPCPLLTVKHRAGHAIVHYAVDSATEFEGHHSGKHIQLKKRTDGTELMLSFNEIDACKLVLDRICSLARIANALPDQDLQRFWFLSKLPLEAVVSTLIDALGQFYDFQLSFVASALSTMLDPYETGKTTASDFYSLVKWCNAQPGAFLMTLHTLMTQIHLKDIVDQKWFHGVIGRTKAEELLQGKLNGSFLCRISSNPLCFALDIVQSNTVHHILCTVKITPQATQFSLPTNGGGDVLYPSLAALLAAERSALQRPVERSPSCAFSQPAMSYIPNLHHPGGQMQPTGQVRALYDLPGTVLPYSTVLAAIPSPFQQVPLMPHQQITPLVQQPIVQPSISSLLQLAPDIIIDWGEIKQGKSIGTGGFGEVFEGEWRGTRVAIKVLNHDRLAERELRDFAAEITMMSKLRHPNILQFLGASLHNSRIALITEYMSGGSLYTQLHGPKALRMSVKDIVRVASGIARGVNYLHLNKPSPIIHRDLKSLNILMGADVKVADFGLSRVKDSTHVMSKVGTPRWTAPEVLASRPYTERADVYSFGIVMWEMLTGEVPFAGMKSFDAAQAVIKTNLRPTIPSTCPDNLSELIRQCWDADPALRPTFDEIIKRLDKIDTRLERR